MTVFVVALIMAAGLVTSALLGPALLRRAAPALVRVPRLAILVVAGGIGVWLVALLAIGPLLAWAGSGPVLLPDGAAEVCRRCLSAANPFSADAGDTLVPAVLLLAVPAALALTLGAVLARRLIRRASDSRRAARTLLHGARRRLVQGREVSIVDAEHPFALTLPARRGGIVLSSGAIRALDEAELAAVLAHEQAHLRQRHHLVSALVDAVAATLRWVPAIRAAADALPHYLEIAADDRARREAGTPALVSALVKLGDRIHTGLGRHDLPAVPVALHAAGPERIRHLVRPGAGTAGALPAVGIAAYLAGMAGLAVAVHLPYLSAALTGCAG